MKEDSFEIIVIIIKRPLYWTSKLKIKTLNSVDCYIFQIFDNDRDRTDILKLYANRPYLNIM